MKKIISFILIGLFISTPIMSEDLFLNPDGTTATSANIDLYKNQIMSLSDSTLIALANIQAGTYNPTEFADLDSKILYDSVSGLNLFDSTTGDILFNSGVE